MRRIGALLLTVVMCCGMLVGCGGEKERKPGFPHNEKISLSDSKEDIIKKDELIELSKDNPSYNYLSQISDSFENAEEELGKQYVKAGDSSVIIDGFEFRVSYILHEGKDLTRVRYRGSNIDTDGNEELLLYLTEMYGEEIKNATYAAYDEYHQIKINEESKMFNVEFGIPKEYPEEVWIEIYLIEK